MASLATRTGTGTHHVSVRVRCAIVAIALAAAGCGSSPTEPSGPVSPGTGSPPSLVPQSAVLVGAGDIGWCGSTATRATAALLDGIDGVVFTAGDNAYLSGTEAQFRDCYEPTWGRHKHRTRPTPGNHDYETPGARPYFAYFGANAGPAGLGYYSFDLGAWHIVSLNSVTPAGSRSVQARWLRQDLQTRSTLCTLAYWHNPLFSSGPNGGQPHMRDVWRILHEFGVEVVVNGDDHLYERFAPQDPDGRPDPIGIRQFIVGTGGAPLYGAQSVQPNSEVRTSTFGVLKLTLRPDSYDWEFVPVPGESSQDSGVGRCH